jgi:cytoskeletal protein CcmA (bactofilin family)
MRTLLFLGLLLVSSTARAADAPAREYVDREAGGDRFTAGGTVNVSAPVAADLLTAGGNVVVDTRVGGDVLAVGGNVRIGGDVDAGVFAAGGDVLLNGRVKRSVRVAGGQVEIGPRAELGGNLSVAGGQVRVEGTVFGYVQVAGGNLVLNGPVGGDVWATGGRITLGPNARIGGRLQYASRAGLQQDPAAIIKGGTERLDFGSERERTQPERKRGGYLGWIWIAGLMVLAVVLVVVAPAFTARVSGALQRQPWFALLLGFIVLVCAPVAAVILLVTVIGLPLGLLALLAYPVLLLIGYELTAIGISDWTMQRFAAQRMQSVAWRAGAAAVAVLLIGLLARLPAIGLVLAFLALLAGIGALVLLWRRPAVA